MPNRFQFWTDYCTAGTSATNSWDSYREFSFNPEKEDMAMKITIKNVKDEEIKCSWCEKTSKANLRIIIEIFSRHEHFCEGCFKRFLMVSMYLTFDNLIEFFGGTTLKIIDDSERECTNCFGNKPESNNQRKVVIYRNDGNGDEATMCFGCLSNAKREYLMMITPST